MLGKRKRNENRPVSRSEIERSSSPSSEDEGEVEAVDANEVFKRLFEQKFAPLPEVVRREEEDLDSGGDDDDSDDDDEDADEEEDGEDAWDGLSDEEDEEDDSPNVEIIEHTNVPLKHTIPKQELKRLLSSKPTSATSATTSQNPKKPTSKDDDDPLEATNLRNDLALQRLISESHLLDSSSSSTFTALGSNRHRATDQRLLSLGAKSSILKQERMPMSHRKGIVEKARVGEEKRRREAKENGIVLEVATANKKSGARRGGGASAAGKRERSVGGPSVGRFKGGTLTLSKNDIRGIEGPKTSSIRGGRGGRGGKNRGKR